MSLEVITKQVGSEAVVRVVGVVNAHSSQLLRKKIAPLFSDGLQTIRVQLDEVRQLDSSGVATLSDGLVWSHQSGGRFVLSGVSGSIASVLQLAKLDGVFEIEPAAGEPS